VPSEKKLSGVFEKAILDDYYEWRRTRPSGDRSGVRYRGMISRYGAVDAIKRLLASSRNRRKGHVGAEEFVIARRFHSLFTQEERREARDRLSQK
jgi:hypothetical protein